MKLSKTDLVVVAGLWIASIAMTALIARRQTSVASTTRGKEAPVNIPLILNTARAVTTPPPQRELEPPARNTDGITGAKELLLQIWELTEGGVLGAQHPVIQSALAAIGETPSADLLTACQSLADPKQRKLLTEYAIEIASVKDPEKCIEFIKKEPAQRQAELTRTTIRNWLKTEPQSAVAWLISNDTTEGTLLGDEKARETLMLEVGNQLGRSDNIEQALLLAGYVTGTSRQSAVLQGLIDTIPSGKLTEFGEELLNSGTLPESIRGASMYEIGKALARKDLESAKHWAEGISTENEPTLASTASVAQVWMKSAPVEAAEWWIGRANPQMLPKVYSEIVGHWAQHSPNQCAQWLSKQPQTEQLDLARAEFAEAVAGRDPESAQKWAESISNEVIRAFVLQKLQ